MISRRALIVHFKTPKVISDVEKHLDIEYISKKYNYLIGYLDAKALKPSMKILNDLKGIKYIENSRFETDRFNFTNKKA